MSNKIFLSNTIPLVLKKQIYSSEIVYKLSYNAILTKIFVQNMYRIHIFIQYLLPVFSISYFK